MQPHRGAPHRCEPLTLVTRNVVDDVIFDQVERVGELAGDYGDGIGEMTDDGFQERHRVGKALAGVDGFERPRNRAERAAPAADDKLVGEGESQPADFTFLALGVAKEIGEHPRNPTGDRLQQQVFVLRKQDGLGAVGDRRIVRDPTSRAVVSEREVQPGPAAGLRQRVAQVAGFNPFGDAVVEAIGKAQPGESAAIADRSVGIEHENPRGARLRNRDNANSAPIFGRQGRYLAGTTFSTRPAELAVRR
jgi:hypothetical protein